MDRIGNCRILEKIGSGGMAVVYKAIQEPLDRVVAIKSLKPSVAVDSQFAKRFEREAHFMASLQHENILHVYDFVNDGQSMHIVMEYIKGVDLYDLLDRTPVMPVEPAAVIALQVARALDYAHFRGIIHRDIKPANVMISNQGEVKLMDFGIARDERLTDLTETGTGLGTPSYMSPEQILGDKLDFRSDLFSLGIVLYQMVTGQKPFVEDDSRTVMQKIRLDRFAPARKVNPRIPRPLERILGRSMEKMPANRYSSTQALIDDLMEFLASRIPGNHNSRLVNFLHETGHLSEAEATEILAASGPGGPARRNGTSRRALARTGWILGAHCAAIMASGALIQAAHGRFSGDSSDFSQKRRSGVMPANAGYLQVVVNPWAKVFIDGEEVLTTPSATRIPLASGIHYLRFENPYYLEKQMQIRIRPQETHRVEVELEPLHGSGATVEEP